MINWIRSRRKSATWELNAISALLKHVSPMCSLYWAQSDVRSVHVCQSVFFIFPSFFPPSLFPLLWAVLQLYYEPLAYNGISNVTNSQPAADELTAVHFLSVFSHTANIYMLIQSQALTNSKSKLSCLMVTCGWNGQRLWYGRGLTQHFLCLQLMRR